MSTHLYFINDFTSLVHEIPGGWFTDGISIFEDSEHTDIHHFVIRVIAFFHHHEAIMQVFQVFAFLRS